MTYSYSGFPIHVWIYAWPWRWFLQFVFYQSFHFVNLIKYERDYYLFSSRLKCSRFGSVTMATYQTNKIFRFGICYGGVMHMSRSVFEMNSYPCLCDVTLSSHFSSLSKLWLVSSIMTKHWKSDYIFKKVLKSKQF